MDPVQNDLGLGQGRLAQGREQFALDRIRLGFNENLV